MVFVTNEHILACFWYENHESKQKERVKVWRVFNVRNGILVKPTQAQDRIWELFDKDLKYELACTDFSNIDNTDERLLVMQSPELNKDTYVF